MANDPTDPFGLNQRDPERDPANGPPVPNMGGIPQTPTSPQANLNPFAIPPVAADQGGRPTEPQPTATPVEPQPAPGAPPAAGEPPKPPATPSGVTINVGSASGGQGQEQPAAPKAPPTGPFGGPAPITMNRLPTSAEISFSPPGTVFETPIGTLTRDPVTGQSKMQLNDAGMVKYKEAKAKAIQSFGGYPLAGDPGAPLPPVEPGQPAYNPFVGGDSGWINVKD